MAGCVTGKKMYMTMELAEEALLHAWSRFDYRNNRGPVAAYRCEDCRNFHLTSSGEMNPKLAEQLKNGELKRRRDASYWEDKLNKRK
jgi:hypothetical protein